MFNIIFIDRFVKLKCSLNTNTAKTIWHFIYFSYRHCENWEVFPGLHCPKGNCDIFQFLLFLSSIARNYFINSAAVINYLILLPPGHFTDLITYSQGPGFEPLLLRLQHAMALRVGEDWLHRARDSQVLCPRHHEGQASLDQPLQPVPVLSCWCWR